MNPDGTSKVREAAADASAVGTAPTIQREQPAGWLCSHDGYLPTNRGSWCDLGCGRDYNQMIPMNAVLVRHWERLERKLGQARCGGLQCCDDHESYRWHCEKCRYFRFYAGAGGSGGSQ